MHLAASLPPSVHLAVNFETSARSLGNDLAGTAGDLTS